MSLRQAVLASYRNLLKTKNIAFKNDSYMLRAAADQIRNEYKNNKNKSLTESEIQELVNNANEAAQFLRYGIVQGVKTEDDAYEVKLRGDQVEHALDSKVDIQGIEEAVTKIERRERRKKKE